MAEDELSFESAEALMDALGVPDPVERRKVLAWIASHQAGAVALTDGADIDLFATLEGMINRDWSYRAWQDIAITIGAFDAPRVTEFFLGLLAEAEDATQAADAASALGLRKGPAAIRERVSEIVCADGPQDRIASAAEVLVDETELPTKVGIRVAVVDSEHPAPPVDAETASFWISELERDYAEGARDRIEEQGKAALGPLAGLWGRLSPENRTWLLDWAVNEAPADPDTAELVSRAVTADDEDTALTGLRAALRLDGAGIGPETLERWAADERLDLRAAAIEAGAPVDVDATLTRDDQPAEIVAALLRRLSAHPADASTAPLIARHLLSEELDVRGTARDALVALGEPALAVLRPLVRDQSPDTRAAAVRALLDLGDDEWLADELLDQQPG
jgi:hypothetical protein